MMLPAEAAQHLGGPGGFAQRDREIGQICPARSADQACLHCILLQIPNSAVVCRSRPASRWARQVCPARLADQACLPALQPAAMFKRQRGLQKPPSISVGLADLPSAIGIPDEPEAAGLDIPFARSLPEQSAVSAAAAQHRRVAWQVRWPCTTNPCTADPCTTHPCTTEPCITNAMHGSVGPFHPAGREQLACSAGLGSSFPPMIWGCVARWQLPQSPVCAQSRLASKLSIILEECSASCPHDPAVMAVLTC